MERKRDLVLTRHLSKNERAKTYRYYYKYKRYQVIAATCKILRSLVYIFSLRSYGCFAQSSRRELNLTYIVQVHAYL